MPERTQTTQGRDMRPETNTKETKPYIHIETTGNEVTCLKRREKLLDEGTLSASGPEIVLKFLIEKKNAFEPNDPS